MPQKSCGVVVWTGPPDQPRFLLLRQALHGHWEFPKGHVEPGESEQETALRELHEEASICEAELDAVFRQEIYYTVATGRGRDPKTVAFFLARTTDGRIALSEEHFEGDWFSYEDAMKMLSFENYRKTLRAAMEHMRKA